MRTPTRTRLAAATAALLFGATTAQALDVFPGAKPVQGLVPDDLVVHRMSDEFYTEAWYFMGRTATGEQFFLHYGVTNAGFGSFTGAVEKTVIDTDGTIHFEKDSKIDDDDIKYPADKLDIDFDGQHRVLFDGKAFQVSSEGDEISFALTIEPLVRGLKFGDGKTYFDEERKEFYALAILTPKARVSGRLKVGDKERNIVGYAYGDHAWQNYPGHKMADRLFSMRGFSDNESASFLTFVTPEGQEIPSLVLTKGNQVALATHRIKTTESGHTPDEEMKDYMLPSKLAIAGTEGGPALKGTIEMTERIQRQDAVEDFSFFERTLIKMFVAKPMLYRYDNSYAFEVSRGAEGLDTYQGSGVVETMILRGE